MHFFINYITFSLIIPLFPYIFVDFRLGDLYDNWLRGIVKVNDKTKVQFVIQESIRNFCLQTVLSFALGIDFQFIIHSIFCLNHILKQYKLQKKQEENSFSASSRRSLLFSSKASVCSFTFVFVWHSLRRCCIQ